MTELQGLQILAWEEQGYRPLVLSPKWQVALLNYLPNFELANLGKIERHNLTDEVFMLVAGRAVIFTLNDHGVILVEEMKKNVIYNVEKGVWHNLLADPDARWVIVEDRDTHLNDKEYRQLTTDELTAVKSRLPYWVT